MEMTKTLVRVPLALVGVLFVAGCGAQTVDVTKVEKNIKDGVKQQNNLDVTVNCPDSVDWRTGGRFTCAVTQPDGTKNTATVTMKSDDGDVSWKVG
jgi:PBP1b-binding outer membrane lipoprotein LpoB